MDIWFTFNMPFHMHCHVILHGRLNIAGHIGSRMEISYSMSSKDFVDLMSDFIWHVVSYFMKCVIEEFIGIFWIEILSQMSYQHFISSFAQSFMLDIMWHFRWRWHIRISYIDFTEIFHADIPYYFSYCDFIYDVI